jgi:hypothetical protein
MTPKYQIFVSSTYEDLKEERQEVVRAILQIGHIPVGMEMFNASDDAQWTVIKRHIDASDYYVVIVAQRYGSTESGISYTEKEFDYALSKSIPVLAFIQNGNAAWPSDRIDKNSEATQCLVAFKDKLRKRIVNFWDTKADLAGKVGMALVSTFMTHPRSGWVPARDAPSSDVLQELSRLSLEASVLRKENQSLRVKLAEDDDSALKEMHRRLMSTPVSLSYRLKDEADEWHSLGSEMTLLDAFYPIAGALVEESHEAYIERVWIVHLVPKEYRYNCVLAANQIVDTMSEFAALDLIKPGKRKRPASDSERYWTLTDLGRRVHKYATFAELERRRDIKVAQDKQQAQLDKSGGDQLPNPNSSPTSGPIVR